jgi:hypothetical protein
MSNLFSHLEVAVYKRYARSLVDSDFQEQFTASIANWESPMLQNQQRCQKVTAWHRADIDRRANLKAEPSEAPLLIRHYLGESTDLLRHIFSDWDLKVLDGNMGELFEIAPKYLGLAQSSAELGFYCAGKEIDPLRSYELEHKYNNLAYQHLIQCVMKAYESDKQKQVNGVSNHPSLHPYYSTLRNVVFLYAQNTIEFLTKARDDLSGKSC